MDPASLAVSVMSVLMPYAIKGAEEFAKSAGVDAYEKVKGLFGVLKARWSGDREAIENLDRFEEKPERYEPVLQDILTEKLAQDKELAEELTDRLNKLGPELEIIQEMEEAQGVIGLKAKEMNR